MPLVPPMIDDRRYQQLVDEALARVPVHTPEWTNFNHSDPGVTLVQLFAFLTENLLYRANQIPERNRIKFLQLLGVSLAPASGARGLITISNERGPAAAQTLPADIEVRAGPVSFRTELGLAVLPVEARVYFKRKLAAPPPNLVDYYRLLYASYQTEMPVDPQLYETIALDRTVVDQVDLGNDTVDRSLWIAILGRRNDDRGPQSDRWKPVRDELAGRTLTLGLVPALNDVQARLAPGGQARSNDLLAFELPASGAIARDAAGNPLPRYRQLEPRTDADLLAAPGVVQLTLPAADDIGLWRDLDPLEAGVGDLPPTLEDSALADRLITWLRVRAPGAARARVLWVGINAVPVVQRERVVAEPLPDGDGTPDQTRRLSRAPVLKGSITVMTRTDTQELTWKEIDDLANAPPEVPVADDRNPPGASRSRRTEEQDSGYFVADHEAGVLTFGDGLRGRRLPLGARVFATYEFCRGSAGNVAAGAIESAPLLPSGFTVTNPVRTWGGADAERVGDGEKQVKRFLQHRDRLVSVADFESIAWRTPGIDVGRIEVLPAFHPDLSPNEPGAAPGVVTTLAIPRFDPEQPYAPRADRLFLNNICRYLDPRRLVTTELIVRGPVYKPLWISVGIDVAAGFAVAEVVEAVKDRLRQFLSPLPPSAGPDGAGFAAQSMPLFFPPSSTTARGWPLRTAVSARVLLAETARVAGVVSVIDVLLAEDARAPSDTVEMTGLELPRVVGISVVPGEPLSIAALRGDAAIAGPAVTGALLPVPIIPETC